MLKYFFAFILFIHGLIHFTGFAKAYNYVNITQLTKYISKPAGVLWLITALLFIVAVLLFLLKKESWPYIAVIAAFISQILFIIVWKDAKFGSIANVIVTFSKDVKSHLLKTSNIQTDLLTEADIQSLPFPVQK